MSYRYCGLCECCFVFFFKQKTAYEMRISDWSSDVCSSDLLLAAARQAGEPEGKYSEAVATRLPGRPEASPEPLGSGRERIPKRGRGLKVNPHFAMQRPAMNRSGVRRGGSLVPAAVLAVARRRLGLGFGLVALLALALQALVGASTAQARPAPESFADLVEGLLPAVVNIQTQQSIEGGQAEQFEEFFKEFFERRGQGGEPPPAPRRGSSLGSGFIIDPSGYIVTNHHVIADADEVEVVLSDGTSLDATIVGSDKDTDLRSEDHTSELQSLMRLSYAVLCFK